jgi:hypothetical protein
MAQVQLLQPRNVAREPGDHHHDVGLPEGRAARARRGGVRSDVRRHAVICAAAAACRLALARKQLGRERPRAGVRHAGAGQRQEEEERRPADAAWQQGQRQRRGARAHSRLPGRFRSPGGGVARWKPAAAGARGAATLKLPARLRWGGGARRSVRRTSAAVAVAARF